MFSLTLPELIGPGAPDAIMRAIRIVAERSFFAVIEPCDDQSFNQMAAKVSGWLTATVRFEEGPVVGSMSCALPDDLGRALFDAFGGRGPSDPPPTTEEVFDLAGEFANMTCGAWLSRCGGQGLFTLSAPEVEPALQPAGADLLRLFAAVNDRPMAVSLRLFRAPQGATAHPGR